MLDGINLDNEASKMKRLDYIAKLEKEVIVFLSTIKELILLIIFWLQNLKQNRELQDSLHEKTMELANLQIKFEQ